MCVVLSFALNYDFSITEKRAVKQQVIKGVDGEAQK